MRRLVPWLVATALLVAAWGVAFVTPDGEQGYSAPHPVAAVIGEPAVGRNIAATIHGLTIADRVSSGPWSAEGTWLVVELDAWVVKRENEAMIGAAILTVGDRTFTASDRPGHYSSKATLYRHGLNLDLPQSGSIAFELPSDVLTDDGAADAMLQLAFGGSNGAEQSVRAGIIADSVIELPVDLPALTREDSLELPPTTWTRP